jgi:hypothetical protein
VITDEEFQRTRARRTPSEDNDLYNQVWYALQVMPLEESNQRGPWKKLKV